MQWIQFRFVTHVLFCYLVLLHLTTHPEATVLISLQNQSWMSFDRLLNLAVCYTEFGRTSNNWVKQVVFRLIYNSYGSGNKYPAFMKSIHWCNANFKSCLKKMIFKQIWIRILPFELKSVLRLSILSYCIRIVWWIREYMVTKEGLLIGPQGLPEDQSAVPP